MGNSSLDSKSICIICKKKLGLLGFICKCNNYYCSLHRHAEKHNCSFDYKKEFKEKFIKNNPVLETKKIIRI